MRRVQDNEEHEGNSSVDSKILEKESVRGKVTLETRSNGETGGHWREE